MGSYAGALLPRVRRVSEPTDVRLTELDVHDDSPANRERLRAWVETLSRGFLEPRAEDAFFASWLADSRRDDVRVTVGEPAAPAVTGLASRLPVATFASWGGHLNVGGELLPLHLISDVTVAPTHRRRGLLSSMMRRDLDVAVAARRPVAALTVSEGSIYGRFGFGAATRMRYVEVDAGPRFAVRAGTMDDVGGRFELAEPAEMIDHVDAVFAGHVARTRGAVGRPAFYRALRSGALNQDRTGPEKGLRGLVHVAADGEVDGYALWRVEEDGPGQLLLLDDLAAHSPAVELATWRFLAEMDLITRIRWQRGRLTDPLELALVDPRVVTTTKVRDLLWVRVLDVVAALEARPWGADGSVVLEVADRLGYAAGRWRVEVAGGRASVTRAEGAAEAGSGEVALDVEALGCLYLGDVRVEDLAAAGRVRGTADSVARLAAMMDGGVAPYCSTGF